MDKIQRKSERLQDKLAHAASSSSSSQPTSSSAPSKAKKRAPRTKSKNAPVGRGRPAKSASRPRTSGARNSSSHAASDAEAWKEKAIKLENEKKELEIKKFEADKKILEADRKTFEAEQKTATVAIEAEKKIAEAAILAKERIAEAAIQAKEKIAEAAIQAKEKIAEAAIQTDRQKFEAEKAKYELEEKHKKEKESWKKRKDGLTDQNLHYRRKEHEKAINMKKEVVDSNQQGTSAMGIEEAQRVEPGNYCQQADAAASGMIVPKNEVVWVKTVPAKQRQRTSSLVNGEANRMEPGNAHQPSDRSSLADSEASHPIPQEFDDANKDRTPLSAPMNSPETRHRETIDSNVWAGRGQLGNQLPAPPGRPTPSLGVLPPPGLDRQKHDHLSLAHPLGSHATRHREPIDRNDGTARGQLGRPFPVPPTGVPPPPGPGRQQHDRTPLSASLNLHETRSSEPIDWSDGTRRGQLGDSFPVPPGLHRPPFGVPPPTPLAYFHQNGYSPAARQQYDRLSTAHGTDVPPPSRQEGTANLNGPVGGSMRSSQPTRATPTGHRNPSSPRGSSHQTHRSSTPISSHRRPNGGDTQLADTSSPSSSSSRKRKADHSASFGECNPRWEIGLKTESERRQQEASEATIAQNPRQRQDADAPTSSNRNSRTPSGRQDQGSSSRATVVQHPPVVAQQPRQRQAEDEPTSSDRYYRAPWGSSSGNDGYRTKFFHRSL